MDVRCPFDLEKLCDMTCGAFLMGTDHQSSKCLRGNFEIQFYGD